MAIFIAMGANVGEPYQNIIGAMRAIGSFATVTSFSSVYVTRPVGLQDQPNFHNMVVGVETPLGPHELLSALLTIEESMGRVREKKDGPRTIDLDLLFYDDLMLNEQGICLPHPRLHKRDFVLLPLAEIAPEFIHPKLNQSIESLARQVGSANIIEVRPHSLTATPG